MKHTFCSVLMITMLALSPSYAVAQCSEARCGPPVNRPIVFVLVPGQLNANPEIITNLTTRKIADAPHIQFKIVPYSSQSELRQLQTESMARPDVGALGIIAEPDQMNVVRNNLSSPREKMPIALILYPNGATSSGAAPISHAAHETQLDESARLFDTLNAETAFAANKYLMNWWLTRK